jgi:outer membrane protein OmpA-like peptidoglycan-associated protein
MVLKKGMYVKCHILVLIIILLFAGPFIGGVKGEERFIFEVTVKNVANHIGTTLRVFAKDEIEARQQVELNGWLIVSVKQITFRKSELVPVRIGNAPPVYVSVDSLSGEKIETPAPAETISDDELINSLLGPPTVDAPLPEPKNLVVPAGGGQMEPNSELLQYLFTIYFAFSLDEPIIEASEIDKINAINKSTVLYMFGHTDNVSVDRRTAPYSDNFELSFLRAEAVKKIFIAEGFNSDSIHTIGLGSMQPAVMNRTGKGGTLENRRVEVYSLRTPDR